MEYTIFLYTHMLLYNHEKYSAKLYIQLEHFYNLKTEHIFNQLSLQLSNLIFFAIKDWGKKIHIKPIIYIKC